MAAGRCPECNTSYGKGAKFCKKCGYPLALEMEKGDPVDLSADLPFPSAALAGDGDSHDEEAAAAAPPTMEGAIADTAKPGASGITDAPVPALCLEVLNGLDAGKKLPLSDGTVLVIGTDPHADLVLNDDYASRRHATVRFHDGRLMLADDGSTNGTYLRVTSGCEIGPGDCLVVGNTCLRVTSEP